MSDTMNASKMRDADDILDPGRHPSFTALAATLPEWHSIASCYGYWRRFMAEKVTFNRLASDIHTVQHAARVLLYALAIGTRCGLDAASLNELSAAAVFHDTRREDDWLDTGHGQRAADYYRAFCGKAGNKLAFDRRVYLMVAYHDLDDAQGREAFAQHGLSEGTILYDIFKDADGLDRFRLGPNALDERMLRTPEALQLVGFARDLVQSTVDHIGPPQGAPNMSSTQDQEA